MATAVLNGVNIVDIELPHENGWMRALAWEGLSARSIQPLTDASVMAKPLAEALTVSSGEMRGRWVVLWEEAIGLK